MIYIVLGMHKSGTTLVSQILHKSNINMGEGFDKDATYDQGNYYERQSVADLNSEILWPCMIPPLDYIITSKLLKKPVPRLPPSLSVLKQLPVSLNAEQRVRMQNIIHECNQQYEDWGFKDPRTCLTYHLWAQELPEHKVISVFRDYNEFLLRYQLYGAQQLKLVTLYRALYVWTVYNLRLLEFINSSKVPMILFNYADFVREDSAFSAFSSFVERTLYDSRDSNYYRHRRVANRSRLPVLARVLLPFLPADPRLVLRRLQALAHRTTPVI